MEQHLSQNPHKLLLTDMCCTAQALLSLLSLLAVSDRGCWLRLSQWIRFLEKVPGVTTDCGGVSFTRMSSSNRESSSILWVSM